MIYVKIRTKETENWGITANVIEELKEQKKPWFVILLSVSSNTGYILFEKDVDFYIANKWILKTNGDYKTTTTFPNENSFNNLEKLRSKIIAEINKSDDNIMKKNPAE